MWKEWTLALLGLAVIVVPFLDLSAETHTWSLVILGAAVAILGFWRAMETTPTTGRTRFQHQ